MLLWDVVWNMEVLTHNILCTKAMLCSINIPENFHKFCQVRQTSCFGIIWICMLISREMQVVPLSQYSSVIKRPKFYCLQWGAMLEQWTPLGKILSFNMQILSLRDQPLSSICTNITWSKCMAPFKIAEDTVRFWKLAFWFPPNICSSADNLLWRNKSRHCKGMENWWKRRTLGKSELPKK